MVTLAASVRSDPDLTEGNVNILISFSATWIRAENVIVERGECGTSLLNSILISRFFSFSGYGVCPLGVFTSYWKQ